MRFFVLPLLVVCVAFTSAAHATVRMTDNPTGCTVVTNSYRLAVDVTHTPMLRLTTPDGKAQLATLGSVWLEQNGRRFSLAADPAPHFHPLRSGSYLVELHIENMILRDGTGDWPGIAELSLYCHEDRVYMVVAFLCQEKEWVNRGLYVYRAAEGHRACPAETPTACGLELTGLAGGARLVDGGAVAPGARTLALRGTIPAGQTSPTLRDNAATFACRPTDTPWQPGSAHEVGGMLAVAASETQARAALDDEAHPLPAEAFTMTMGQCVGYAPERGVYALTAQTSGTPDPPRSLRAGTRYTLQGDGRARTILVDQRDPWGGISGGILRDGAGEPLPVVIQFGLNYPELNAEAGEPGWATLTYPLTLRPNERREIRGEHLYRALADREVIYLNSLEDIGDPLLLQTTVGRSEAHTLTTGPYPGKLTPGNELRINDFRRIYSQLRSRSASAILPTFFGYWDANGDYQGLMPGYVTMRETSPFLAEYTIDAATRDGAVTGTLRTWEAPHDDMTRVFTEVSLKVNRPVRLDPKHEAPLFFLRHHAFNPMAFMRFAYTQADGSTHEGELTYARTVVANRAPLGPLPLGCLYRAGNELENHIACSDITGNSGFVVLDWDVRFGAQAIKPGCYAFCTGAGDVPDGDYARDLAVVPTEPISEIPAGNVIHYRAVQMVYGDNSSDYKTMERERSMWALKPLRATAQTGSVVSSDPPEFRAAGGRVEAEITGGGNWIPVRVRGMRPGMRLHVRQADSAGDRELGPGAPDEPWYNAWPDANGACGFTFLVKTPGDGGPMRLTVWQ
jgi:hypothetical protein